MFGPDPDPYYAPYDGLKDSRFAEDTAIDVGELVARTASAAGKLQQDAVQYDPEDPYVGVVMQRGVSDAPLERRKTAK